MLVFWTLAKPLAGAIALLAAYVWMLTRVAHGGKGWPRLPRKRNRRTHTRRGRNLPSDRLCRKPQTFMPTLQ